MVKYLCFRPTDLVAPFHYSTVIEPLTKSLPMIAGIQCDVSFQYKYSRQYCKKQDWEIFYNKLKIRFKNDSSYINRINDSMKQAALDCEPVIKFAKSSLRKINSIYELFSLHKYVTDKVNVHAGYTVLLDTLVEFTMNSVIKIIRDVLKTSINENKNIDYESQLLAINIINDSKKFTKTKEAFYSLCTLLEELNAIPNVKNIVCNNNPKNAMKKLKKNKEGSIFLLHVKKFQKKYFYFGPIDIYFPRWENSEMILKLIKDNIRFYRINISKKIQNYMIFKKKGIERANDFIKKNREILDKQNFFDLVKFTQDLWFSRENEHYHIVSKWMVLLRKIAMKIGNNLKRYYSIENKLIFFAYPYEIKSLSNDKVNIDVFKKILISREKKFLLDSKRNPPAVINI